MKIAAKADRDSDMVGKWGDSGIDPMGGEKRRVHKPIEITTMLVGGSSCVGDLTAPVPLGRKIGRVDIPIASHEPRNPPYASEQLLKLGKQLATDRVRLRVSAWGGRTPR